MLTPEQAQQAAVQYWQHGAAQMLQTMMQSMMQSRPAPAALDNSAWEDRFAEEQRRREESEEGMGEERDRGETRGGQKKRGETKRSLVESIDFRCNLPV